MPTSKIVYKVFVSSPSDVSDERKIVSEVVNQINRLRKSRSSIVLETMTWEKDVVPKFGSKPQEEINKITVGQYDIFLGIMCSRFGTETDKAGSGTEEEFQIAYNKKIEDPDSVEVLFYFKDPRSSKDPIDADQFVNVSKFKKSMQSNGKYNGIYGEFGAADEFKTELTVHLNSILDEFEKKPDLVITPDKQDEPDVHISAPTSISDPLAQLISTANDEEEIGIFEIVEDLEASANSLVENLKSMNDIMGSLNTNIRNRTQAITDLGNASNPSQVKLKKLLDLVAGDMNRFVQKSKGALPLLQDSLEINLDLYRKFVVLISEDQSVSETEKDELRDKLLSLLTNMQEASRSFDGFSDSVGGLPRMTSKVNRSRKSVRAIADGTSEMLNSAHVQLEAIYESL